MESLQGELAEVRASHHHLLETLEVKERRVKEVEILLREAGGGGDRAAGGERIHQMEVRPHHPTWRRWTWPGSPTSWPR